MKQVPLTVFLALAVLAGAAFAGEDNSILVELYTSQGCSSCPPADALLTKLTQRKGLIAVSLPITYWDMLGWKDTLATQANTERQKHYSEMLGRGGVYTPQIVIDGLTDLLGSRKDADEAAIALRAKALAGTEPQARLQLRLGATALHLGIAAAHGAKPPAATIWLAIVRPSAHVKITGGENAGHVVSYRNVVVGLKPLGEWNGRALSLDLPRSVVGASGDDAVAVIVQQGGYGAILGATPLTGTTPEN